jgi:hypothetical protein
LAAGCWSLVSDENIYSFVVPAQQMKKLNRLRPWFSLHLSQGYDPESAHRLLITFPQLHAIMTQSPQTGPFEPGMLSKSRAAAFANQLGTALSSHLNESWSSENP